MRWCSIFRTSAHARTHTSQRCAGTQECAKNEHRDDHPRSPNPLGGDRIEGPGLVKKFESFVGYIDVPYVHGLTMGELAQRVREKYVPKYQNLKIVKMQGWRRNMTWADTGHEWVATSPHVPDAKSCAGYASTGIIGELLVMSIGVGYRTVSNLWASPWMMARRWRMR